MTAPSDPTPPYVCFVQTPQEPSVSTATSPGQLIMPFVLWVVDSTGWYWNPGNPGNPYNVEATLAFSDASGDTLRTRVDGLISDYLVSLSITGLDASTAIYWLASCG